MVDQFTRGMGMMRKHNPQIQEDGFGLVKQVAHEHVADLITAYSGEEDHGLRCWLLELIGEARSAEALPVLREALASPDESIRDWARIGLEQLGTKEARALLWRHPPDSPPHAAALRQRLDAIRAGDGTATWIAL
ncbi:HEAT repeat domain-containing protein [Kribbella sp. CA-245084]|uniref:HEAT repeat domain-containing protein n=1 Tax=Kribbella sp. CA-245084 TaxID=3239940 RepID=UPI003D91C2BE